MYDSSTDVNWNEIYKSKRDKSVIEKLQGIFNDTESSFSYDRDRSELEFNEYTPSLTNDSDNSSDTASLPSFNEFDNFW